MAANILRNHNRNPYKPTKNRQQVVVFMANGYHANLLILQSPIAIRVMLALMDTLNGEGYATATLNDLSGRVQMSRTYVNKGILELARLDLIRKKRRGQYWINSGLFRPALIEV